MLGCKDIYIAFAQRRVDYDVSLHFVAHRAQTICQSVFSDLAVVVIDLICRHAVRRSR